MRDFLMKGGWYTLVQAGRLLADARLLFDSGAYGTATGLALLSREELAKSRKVFALWMRVNRGGHVTRHEVLKSIEMDHVEKQRHGASMFSIPVDRSTLEILVRPGDAWPDELSEARQRVDRMLRAVIKRAPGTRHALRLRAFYVDPAPRGDTWLRPADITHGEAEAVLIDAGNDYWQHHKPGMPGPASDIEALNSALEAWTDKPPLPPGEFR